MDNNINNPFKNEENIQDGTKNENINENQDDNITNEESQNIKDESAETEIEDVSDSASNKEKELQLKLDELNNKYIRLAADFDNFRKRTQQEKEDLSIYTTVKILNSLTFALDTFDRAKEHLQEVDDCEKIKEGYEMAYKQLLDVLKKIGLEEMEALGQPFNPNEHEAVVQIPTDEYDVDCVASIMQKGYKLNKKVVRPALVGVAIKKED